MKIVDLIKKNKPFLSLEFFPPKNRDSWPKFFEVVEKLKVLNPLFASVTYGAGGGTQDNSLEIVKRMKQDAGIEPIAHLTCVGASPENISEFVNALQQAGVDNILALRGDAPQDDENFDFNTQTFKHGSDLVTYVQKTHPDMGIAVAGYPEAHLESPSIKEDFKWMKYKIDEGGEFIITQLFFDNRIYFDFCERMKAMGVNVPIVPGVLPIMSLKSAKFILSLCGAAIPGKFLSALEKAHSEGGDEAVYKLGINFATKQAQELLDGGAPGVHLYTLNRAKACLEIGHALRFK
ncbi:methylenetetrahydrofolate reductase [NAD(P)H] [Maridesulfovibrio hydrothermalis]|uniref:Methylenetetrahydrofolate reductase n=1 Tax=Maridesulfovibrio hydrothermalis AM13 = DSM 14728 TaxID=1121451 RepID=L0RDD1_9BACT|nr:methylenetetrahydrofolate reductase [NAD(P)H] [Maridesulfovibrio hydrothermalis]CCO24210.1 5,10-methylenetetrahydrofolate reductase [Maridesulfovibrio hydrothermalis AM13 = DSM 14728]